MYSLQTAGLRGLSFDAADNVPNRRVVVSTSLDLFVVMTNMSVCLGRGSRDGGYMWDRVWSC